MQLTHLKEPKENGSNSIYICNKFEEFNSGLNRIEVLNSSVCLFSFLDTDLNNKLKLNLFPREKDWDSAVYLGQIFS